MNAVKEFNVLLNHSTNNRYLRWEEYRNNLTEYIKYLLPEISESILVLGCGNSDDLDLSIIKNRCHKLTLSDIDGEALLNAMKKYDLNVENTIVKPFDVTGLGDNHLWNNFVNEMAKIGTIDEISSFFIQLKTIITEYSFRDFTQQYDAIIISPIYTQLLFQQGMSYISMLDNLNYPQELLEKIGEELLNLMPYLIDNFNLEIVKLLKNNGIVIVMSDIFEVSIDSDIYSNLKSLHEIDSYHEEYMKKYGIGLGDYGLINLEDKLQKHNQKWFEWPFSPEKSLFVKVMKLKN